MTHGRMLQGRHANAALGRPKRTRRVSSRTFLCFSLGVVFQDDYQAFPCKYLRTPTRLSVIFDDRDRFSEILLCTWQKRENEGLLRRF